LDVPAGASLARLERGGYHNALYDVHVNDAIPYVLRVYGDHATPKCTQHEPMILRRL